MPLKAVKNSCRSASRSKPTRRLRIENIIEAPRPAIFIVIPVGFMKTFIERPSMNWVSRRGASRKSSALRVGGVSSTKRSKRPSEWSSNSFSIAMYSCEPASAAEICW